LKLRQEHYLSDVEEKKNEILESYEEQMEELLHSVQRQDVKMHEVIAAKKKMDDLQQGAKEQHFSGPVAVGDYVNIPSLYSSGRVISIQGQKVEVVSKEGLTFKTKLDQVIKVPEPPKDDRQPTSGLKLDEMAFQKSVPLELNLIGQHVDEASLSLEKYLDECRLKGFKRVRIIHGWGSGALRNLVRDYLDAHPEFVASYEGADGTEGGGGATIVHLR
jgi:DNA mismatch repair protein MutS2